MMNQLVSDVAESVHSEICRALCEIWDREDAAHILAGFLDGDVRFQIDRHGISILVRDTPADSAGSSEGPIVA